MTSTPRIGRFMIYAQSVGQRLLITTERLQYKKSLGRIFGAATPPGALVSNATDLRLCWHMEGISILPPWKNILQRAHAASRALVAWGSV